MATATLVEETTKVRELTCFACGEPAITGRVSPAAAGELEQLKAHNGTVLEERFSDVLRHQPACEECYQAMSQQCAWGGNEDGSPCSNPVTRVIPCAVCGGHPACANLSHGLPEFLLDEEPVREPQTREFLESIGYMTADGVNFTKA